MTIKNINCSTIINLCDNQLGQYEIKRKENLEKWIDKYSSYTTGFLFWKQYHQRSRKDTIEYLNSNQFIEDSLSNVSYDYYHYINEVEPNDNELQVINILNLAKAGTDLKMNISKEDYALITREF